MNKFKVLMLTAATTITLSAAVIASHSVNAFADTLSDIPGNTHSSITQPKETPKVLQAQNFAAQANISNNFYDYNIPGVQKVKYGTSGLGRPLYYYKIGNGKKTLLANFAIHGYEDSWAQDGYALTQIAHQLIEKFNTLNKTSGLNGWSIIIIPCANPDGVLDGYTNNGPGRCQISQKIDLNRDFPTYFEPEYNSRNYTGPKPLGCPEAKDLANLVSSIGRQSQDFVLLDVHGWLDMTIGDPQIGQYFINNLGLLENKGYKGTGHGYLISYGHAQGAEVSLVELPDTSSQAQVNQRNYVGKLYNSMLQVMNNGTGLTLMNKEGEVVNTTIPLNIRSGATTVGSIIGTYPVGSKINIVGKIGDWYKIYKQGIGYGYVSADYVKLTGNSSSIPDTSTNGWKQTNSTWYYYTNGNYATGWKEINNVWYYFNSNGQMQTGWLKQNNNWYYLNSDGSMQTGWLNKDNTWYHFNISGIMQTGWIDLNNTWYYLNSDGSMQVGWLYENNTWYYLNSNGSMQTGWDLINNTWYYFNSNGSMATNTTIDGWQIDSHGVATKQ